MVGGFLEIYGTSVGAWSWAEFAPGTNLPAGNPPSGIAGIYVQFDITAIVLAPGLLARLEPMRCMPPLAQLANAG